MAHYPKLTIIRCDMCNVIITEDHGRETYLPDGTMWALKVDGFKENRMFCSQTCFDNFYKTHQEEL